jgi:pyridoxal phosphate enzyme (YggS family)
MIESVDSVRLLKVINDEAGKVGRKIPCLLQVHIAEEESKFGFGADEISDIIDNEGILSLNNVIISGLMGMATFTDDKVKVKNEFTVLSDCFRKLKLKFFKENDGFCEISMGMSGDFLTAIEAGSTMVRLGSIIFGERN